MKLLSILLCLACVTSVHKAIGQTMSINQTRQLIDSLIRHKPFSVVAVLNDSAWFGSANAQKEYVPTRKSCVGDRFTLNVFTDIPHTLSYSQPSKKITGCVDHCIPTQYLKIRNIPVAVGHYKLYDLQSCLEENVTHIAEYVLIIGGDGVVNRYYLAETTKLSDHDYNWIEVTKYDEKLNQIEGKFDIKLAGYKKEIVHFEKGNFRVNVDK
jgi:hypothetical protein